MTSPSVKQRFRVNELDRPEPLSHSGVPTGVLVIHRFTGSPQSMALLAHSLIVDFIGTHS